MKNTVESTSVPALTREQMREVDRIMVEEYGITLLQMMENAGRNLAWLALQWLDGDLVDRPIVVLAGRGNNGGGGLVAARHLANWGAWVQVLCSHPPDTYQGAPAQQLAILQAMEVPLAWAEEGWELPPCDLVVDALIGYGLKGDPRGRVRDLIQLANSSVAPILSLDVPSGLDADTGQGATPHIRAAATLTLALPKQGLLTPTGQALSGDLYLADISVPPGLYRRLGLEVPPLFSAGTVLPLTVVDGQALIQGDAGRAPWT